MQYFLTHIKSLFLMACLAILSAVCVPSWSKPNSRLSPELQQGKYLSELALCYSCHTSDEGQPFAGGRALVTPLGTFYSPNITPDEKTGIGSITDEEFYRTLHEGVSRNGEHLYPLMPYSSYTGISYEDAMLIKAWLMEQEPIVAQEMPNELDFPYDYRQIIGWWKILNFHQGEQHAPSSSNNLDLQRGAYIAENLATCGSCHTPRTLTMSTDANRALTGAAVLDGWYAPNITQDKVRGIGKWTNAELEQYLRTGVIEGKAYASGPMKEVINEALKNLTDEDMTSLLNWLNHVPFDGGAATHTQSRSEWGRKQDFSTSVLPSSDTEQMPVMGVASQIYYSECARCHGNDGGGNLEKGIPNFVRNTTLGMSTPNNVIKVILEGEHSTNQDANAVNMPAFKDKLDNEQIAELTNWLFLHYGRDKTTTNAAKVNELRLNITTEDAPVTALLKASSIALFSLAFIFVLGWIIRFSPRVKALVASLKKKYKSK